MTTYRNLMMQSQTIAVENWSIMLTNHVFTGFVKIRGEIFACWGRSGGRMYRYRSDAENAVQKIMRSKGWHEGITDYIRIEKV